MTLTITMQCQRHENDDVNNRVTKEMTDDKEHNIDRDNSIVNDNNKDKEIFFSSSCHERVTKKNF